MMVLSLRLPGCDHRLIAGVDEAGRGPLAGDVVAAAVILDPARPVPEVRDSKKLSAPQRERLHARICEHALCYAVARASVQEIDRLNILQASLLAMQRAVSALSTAPDFVYVDGNQCPSWMFRSEAVVKGDGLIASIAAASILAKVERDRDMLMLDRKYPGYGFARHKGYPTALHLESLARLGPCGAHRLTFAPVSKVINRRAGCR